MSWNLPNLMEVSEVAQHLHVTPQTVSRIRRRGQLSGVLVGRRYFYDPDDVRSFIESQRTGIA